MRKCAVCGQVDDHPRHVFYIPPDGVEVSVHMDCPHSATGELGAPCEFCTETLAGAGGAQGDTLRSHIIGGN